MEIPHHFTRGHIDHPRLCVECGREKNDYEYHFTEETNVCWSGPSPSEQERAEATVKQIGRANLIEWIRASHVETVAGRIEALETLLRVLVVADDREGSQDAFGYIAVGIAKEARKLLK